MSDGLVSLLSTLLKHGSRLSALEESQHSLSQRLRNLEANPSLSAPSAPDDKDEDMGSGPSNRGRARSCGPVRPCGQPHSQRTSSAPHRGTYDDRQAKPDWQKKLVVLKGYANRHTLQEFRAMLSTNLDVPASARVCVRVKIDIKCQ
eukprot:5598241-Amphidinium_carterae.1